MWILSIVFGFIILLAYLPSLQNEDVSGFFCALAGTVVGLLSALIYTKLVTVEKFNKLQTKNKTSSKGARIVAAAGVIAGPLLPLHLVPPGLFSGLMAAVGSFIVAMLFAIRYKYEG